jgi:hypothetical protein
MKARFQIHENENATLSGVPQDILRDIITEASIKVFDRLEKAEKENDQESIHYFENIRKSLDHIGKAINKGIDDTFGPKEIRKPTKAERFAIVNKEIKFRKMMDEFLASCQK